MGWETGISKVWNLLKDWITVFDSFLGITFQNNTSHHDYGKHGLLEHNTINTISNLVSLEQICLDSSPTHTLDLPKSQYVFDTISETY